MVPDSVNKVIILLLIIRGGVYKFVKIIYFNNMLYILIKKRGRGGVASFALQFFFFL